MDRFVADKVEPLSFLGILPADVKNSRRNELVRPLQAEVKAQGLWVSHLGPGLGGQGDGQVKLGLVNEILGRSSFAPSVFGCQAPDTGNAETIAHYGTAASQKSSRPCGICAEAHPAVQVPNCSLAVATGIGGSLGTRHGAATQILERQ